MSEDFATFKEKIFETILGVIFDEFVWVEGGIDIFSFAAMKISSVSMEIAREIAIALVGYLRASPSSDSMIPNSFLHYRITVGRRTVDWEG